MTHRIVRVIHIAVRLQSNPDVQRRAEGRPAYENRLHLPYGKPVTVTTDLGTWTTPPACPATARRTAKDMGLAPGQ
ncbi:hypothetical protein [Streptomyces sp. NPDC002845]